MITAELNHNPYLLLTTVKFNGQTPKINSQVEKYEGKPLKDWVRFIPNIFYNEMNGYDFDLFFSGTKSDFEEITQAFKEAGVTEEQVRLHHKNEIEDAVLKSKEIASLLSWIRSHPNRRFDYNHFWEENSEMFEGRYPVIVINGDVVGQSYSSIEYESVDSANKLLNMDLTNTPILFHINKDSRRSFRKDLDIVLEIKEVVCDQLFFMIDPKLNEEQIVRVISDLGVKSPCVVDSYMDDRIISYVRNYPMSQYVRDCIDLFKSSFESVSTILNKEIEKSQITNESIHGEIEQIESEIWRLKETNEFCVQRDNYVIPYEFNEEKIKLIQQIQKWKIHKMKITGEEESEAAAINYSEYFSKLFYQFYNSINSIYVEWEKKIAAYYSDKYLAMGIDMDYVPQESCLADYPYIECPYIKDELLELKEIDYVEAKADFFGFLKKSESSEDMVKVVTCYLEQWRLRAADLMLTVAEALIRQCNENLKLFYDLLAEEYHRHLIFLIETKSSEKESASLKLSKDERMLQEDSDWMAEVRSQLSNIERG